MKGGFGHAFENSLCKSLFEKVLHWQSLNKHNKMNK